MSQRLYKGDPLSPDERDELECDLISFCDRELDLLGDVGGLRVLYAGGASPLWIEGLARRVGSGGSLTALEADPERIEAARTLLPQAEVPCPVRLVHGDVFDPPFAGETFDLVYSAGLFHELDVGRRPASEALRALARVTRPGGRIATSDFVDTVPATQLEDENLQRLAARERSGAVLYGIGPPGRLISLHETVLAHVRWRISPPFRIRHLEKLVLRELCDPAGSYPTLARSHPGRIEALRQRILREGYTRPATLYVEGTVSTEVCKK